MEEGRRSGTEQVEEEMGGRSRLVLGGEAHGEVNCNKESEKERVR